MVGDQAPANLAILVLDNERFAETGRQRGLTSGRADIAAVAQAVGIAKTMTVTEQGKAAELADFLFKAPGPVLAVAHLRVARVPHRVPRTRQKYGARRKAELLRFSAALGVEETARTMNVPATTLTRWQRDMRRHALNGHAQGEAAR